MSVPRPGRSAYLRRLRENQMQAQLNIARAALARRRGQLVGLVVGVLLFAAALGGAAAVAIDRVFR